MNVLFSTPFTQHFRSFVHNTFFLIKTELFTTSKKQKKIHIKI